MHLIVIIWYKNTVIFYKLKALKRLILLVFVVSKIKNERNQHIFI